MTPLRDFRRRSAENDGKHAAAPIRSPSGFETDAECPRYPQLRPLTSIAAHVVALAELWDAAA